MARLQTSLDRRAVGWLSGTRCFALVLLVFSASPAPPFLLPSSAEDVESTPKQPPSELEKAIKSLTPRPSTDTTPIEFSIAGTRFRIPRNYLTVMENWRGGPQGLVAIRINLADLRPRSNDNRACFQPGPNRPPDCEPIEVTINAPGLVTAEQAFANLSGVFRSKIPQKGPAGFDKYETGPEDARAEYYVKRSQRGMLFYVCQIFDNHGVRDGICDPVDDRLQTGTVLHFYFKLNHLPDIEGIDAGLRKLVDGFALKGE